MPDHTFIDICSSARTGHLLEHGLLAVFAERMGAARYKLMIDDGVSPTPSKASTTKTTPPKETPATNKTTVEKATAPKLTPAQADAQGRAGVAENKAPSAPAAPEAPKPDVKKPDAAAIQAQEKADVIKAKNKTDAPETAAPKTAVPDAEPAAPVQGDRNNDGELSADEEHTLLRGMANERQAAQRAQEVERRTAASLDQLTAAEREAALARQAELEREETEARERNRPAERPAGQVNRAIAEELAASNAASAQQADTEVRETREEYFAEHDVWVDADGTVYAAELDEDGNIVLERNATVAATADAPELRTSRTATIATDRSRTDVAATSTVPTGEPGEVEQTRTETSHTNADGSAGESQIRLDQERRNEDGSTERSRTEENYDPQGVAINRIQEQEQTQSNGDASLDRTTTAFRADGQTAEHVTTLATTSSGDSDATSSRETTTNYAGDSTTPTRQVVVAGGMDADGAELLETTAATRFAPSGEPATTYIERRGEGLPQHATRTEYVVWNDEGTVDRRVTGGAGVSEYEYGEFVETGTVPEEREGPGEEPQQPVASGYASYTSASGYSIYAGTVSSATGETYSEAMAEYEAEHAAWVEARDEAEAFNRDNTLTEVDPETIPGGEDIMRWTRNEDNVFEGASLGGNLVEPLEASTQTPSVFEVPAAVQARANAAAIDQSAPATDPAAFARLDEQQAAFERQLSGAASDDQRRELMSTYFADHEYWIERGTGEGATPVLMASAWSTGGPQSSELFGASRAANAHATMARTGVQGTDDMGQAATIDVVQNLYVDGTQDDLVRTSYDGMAGASRVVVTGEHTNAAGVVVERDRNAQTQVARTEQGLPPLAVTETSRERFDAASGTPVGEQSFAVAQSDHLRTTLEERRDQYGTDGIIEDTKIESTQMSRNWDADVTEDFMEANRAIIENARGGDFNPNEDGTQVTVPSAGSNYVHSLTDIDYDDAGTAIHQRVDETSVMVADSGDENHNGVRINETATTRVAGTPGGMTPIFDEAGALAVNEQVETKVTSTEYDPDAGTAGGNRSLGHQFREITTMTMSQTRGPGGVVISQSASPLTMQTLREGFDDDWVFDEKQLATTETGEVRFEGEGDDRKPIEVDDSQIHHEHHLLRGIGAGHRGQARHEVPPARPREHPRRAAAYAGGAPAGQRRGDLRLPVRAHGLGRERLLRPVRRQSRRAPDRWWRMVSRRRSGVPGSSGVRHGRDRRP